MLLQPQPRTIRPKGDAIVLRKLLLECSQLQDARRLRKRQRRCQRQPEQNDHSHKHSNNLARIEYKERTNFEQASCNVTNVDTASLASLTREDNSFGVIFREPNIIQSWPYGELNGNLTPTPIPAFNFGMPTQDSSLTESEFAVASCAGHLQEFGLQPQSTGALFSEEDNSRSMCSPGAALDIYNHDSNFQSGIPGIGFDLDFGLTPFNPSLNSNLASVEFGLPYDIAAATGYEHQDQNTRLPLETAVSSKISVSPREKRPRVNSTYLEDISDNASSFLSLSDSYYDLQPTSAGEAIICDFKSFSCSQENAGTSSEDVFSDPEPEALSTKYRQISNPPSSTSRISTLLSKMSLSPPSTPNHTNDSLAGMFICPIILPGVFPEYCWQHITRNTLRHCGTAYGAQNCNSGRKSTHQCLPADVLNNIAQRNVRSTDIDETDTFGNSTLHILAATMAPSSYLMHLIKLGANINHLNKAGQTFLHLVKHELLDQCEDFCSLLELLSDKGFNFSQLDHLGQSPLHLLVRPWIRSETLHRIITKINSLPLRGQISTARDCLGYTVVEELNLQETSAVWADVDQAILSLVCETGKPIARFEDLQSATDKVYGNASLPNDDQFDRNYENHPLINTVDDLVQYEQHVDYWRTIIAAKNYPWLEDSDGRNGLHCLAEASLVSSNSPLPDRLQAQYKSLMKAAHVDGRSERECLVDFLLSAGVDPNNYDKAGNTPLMAFILHRRPAESEETSAHLLRSLLKAGSDINRRNRQGETALHLGVKFGYRAATQALLAAGANIHARTRSGLGILELGQKYARESKQNEELFAQIMLCLTLSASFGAVSKPTILDEWGSPRQVPKGSHPERKGFSRIKNFILKKARGRRVTS